MTKRTGKIDWRNTDSPWHAHPSNHRLMPGGSEYESRYLWVRAQVERGQRGLDVGCNCGQLIVNLVQDLGCEMVGVDIVNEFVEHCRVAKGQFGEYHEMDFSRIGLRALKKALGDQPFDFVTALELIEHPIDVRGFKERVLRVLKPGGKLIVTTPHPQSPSYGYKYMHQHPHHVRVWTPWRLRAAFAPLVLEVEHEIRNQGELTQLGAVFRKGKEK